MSNSASRLITLILLLQSRPNRKASELARQLHVSVRTIHRYFGMLDEMGIPVYAERGPYGGFSLVRGYRMPPLVFSAEEAVAVCLGASLVSQMWGPLYLDAAQSAIAKLENILPDEQRGEVQWAQRALVATHVYRGDASEASPALQKLRCAARDHLQVSAVYQGAANTRATRRRIDPYALVFRAGLWYVVGYCHLRSAPRTFRLDRFRELSISDRHFEAPHGFDIRAYLDAEFKTDSAIRARLRFKPEAAHIVAENRILWESVEGQADGGVIVTMAASDLRWLASMALSFANLVTVLEPPELQEMVRDWARATADLYPSTRNSQKPTLRRNKA